jgi:hypothetical protein
MNKTFHYLSEERFNLTNVPQRFLTKNHGINYVHFERMINATAPSSIEWVAYLPYFAEIYPTFEEPWEIFGLISFFVLYSFTLYTIYFFTTQYFKKRNPMHLKHLLVMCVWLIWLILYTTITYCEIYNEIEINRLVGVASVFYGFCSLFSVMTTTSMLVGVAGQSQEVNYMIYGSVLLTHIVLYGANYVYYVYITTKSTDLKYGISRWGLLSLYWNVIALTIIISPVCYLIYKVVIKSNANNRDNELENGGPWKRLDRLLRLDLKVTAMLAIYFGSIGLWAIITFMITFSSYAFGDERIRLVVKTLGRVFFMVPYVVNTFFLDHVPGK